jgi:AcrR family transcriptional regulator
MAYRETDRVRQRKAATRIRLLHGAESLVRESGFAGLTMQALAERAGVGVGTVYRYFDAKHDLASEVFRRVTEREVAAVSRALSVAGSPGERLRQGLQVFATRALQSPRLAWALIAEPVSPAVDAERLKYRPAYAGLFQTLIEQGVRDGSFPDQPPPLVASALVGAVAEALTGPLTDDRPSPDLIEPLCDLCLRAVGVPATT